MNEFQKVRGDFGGPQKKLNEGGPVFSVQE